MADTTLDKVRHLWDLPIDDIDRGRNVCVRYERSLTGSWNLDDVAQAALADLGLPVLDRGGLHPVEPYIAGSSQMRV